MEKPFIRRLKSFAYALQGMAFLVRTEPNARVHLLVTILVCAAGVYFRLSPSDRKTMTTEYHLLSIRF